MGNVELVDGMIHDGLWDVYGQHHMGICAEHCATTQDISRAAQDEYAVESTRRAIEAQKAGAFKAEIVPVELEGKKGEKTVVADDDGPKGARPEKIPALRPVFKKDGTVTAANASSINDGAAAVVLMSAERAKKEGRQVLARITAWGGAARAPVEFTIAPADAAAAARAAILAAAELAAARAEAEAEAAEDAARAAEVEVETLRSSINGSIAGDITARWAAAHPTVAATQETARPLTGTRAGAGVPAAARSARAAAALPVEVAGSTESAALAGSAALPPLTGAMATTASRRCNAFPGAPVLVGRQRLEAPRLGAVLVNNKISNVCAPGGVDTANRISAEAARLLGTQAHAIQDDRLTAALDLARRAEGREGEEGVGEVLPEHLGDVELRAAVVIRLGVQPERAAGAGAPGAPGALRRRGPAHRPQRAAPAAPTMANGTRRGPDPNPPPPTRPRS